MGAATPHPITEDRPLRVLIAEDHVLLREGLAQLIAFMRRGLAACQAEWRLIAATHNLLKPLASAARVVGLRERAPQQARYSTKPNLVSAPA